MDIHAKVPFLEEDRSSPFQPCHAMQCNARSRLLAGWLTGQGRKDRTGAWEADER